MVPTLNFPRQRVGDFTITAISDGYLTASLDFLANIDTAEATRMGLLVWGDVVHFPHIQIERPDVSIAFDQDASLAASTRSRLLDQVSSERLLIAGMHLGEAGFARIKRTRGKYGLLYETEA